MAEVKPVSVTEDDLLDVDTDDTPLIGGGVYVFYDKDGTPLYVGQTSSYRRRFSQHKACRKWWPHVKSAKRLDFCSESDRLIAETILIFRLRPIHNQLIKLRLTKEGDVTAARW